MRRAAPSAPIATGVPPTVSLNLKEVAVAEVFRALGAVLGVAVVLDGQVNRPPVTIKFNAAGTRVALDFLCNRAGCAWEFDQGARELRVRFSTK